MEKEKYSILTEEIKTNKELTDFQKILYSEIISLTKKDGFCWASNTFFAKKFGKSSSYISKSINKFKALGLLKIFIDQENGNIRKIHIGKTKNVSGKVSITEVQELGNSSDIPIVQEGQPLYHGSDRPYSTTVLTNNINIKNKNKISKDILYEKKQKSFLEIFKEKILENEEFLEKVENKFNLDKENFKSSAENFLIYWTEKNENGKKEKWEKQKTFDIQKRFYMWLSNEKKWNKNKKFENKTGYVNIDF